MSNETLSSNERGFKKMFRDLYVNSKEAISLELEIVKRESNAVAKKTTLHLILIAIFGGLLLVSQLALLAFAVIFLGQILNNNYWASALIIGLIGSFVGATVTYFSFVRLREDLKFPDSTSTLQRLFGVFSRAFNF